MNQKTTQSIRDENCATERGKMDVEQVPEEQVPEVLVVVDAAVAQLHRRTSSPTPS